MHVDILILNRLTDLVWRWLIYWHRIESFIIINDYGLFVRCVSFMCVYLCILCTRSDVLVFLHKHMRMYPYGLMFGQHFQFTICFMLISSNLKLIVLFLFVWVFHFLYEKYDQIRNPSSYSYSCVHASEKKKWGRREMNRINHLANS